MKSKISAYQRWRRWFFRGPLYYGALQKPYWLTKATPTYVLFYWFNFLTLKHFSFVGRASFLLSCFVLVYGLLDPKSMPITHLAFALLALYALGFILSWFLRPRVKLKRFLPYSAHSHSSINVQYQIENLSRWSSWDLFLDSLPYKNLELPEGIAYVEELKAKETFRCNVPFRFEHRGLFLLPHCNISSTFPFGLMKWLIFSPEAQEILILPQKFPITSLSFSSQAQDQLAQSVIQKKGSTADFFGCREYQVGDNIKHIHWSSWARTGVPVIKEFSEQGQGRISLFLDLELHDNPLDKYNRKKDLYLEQVISIAAGFIEVASLQGVFCDQLIVGKQNVELADSQTAILAKEKIMEALSMINAHEEQEWQEEQIIDLFHENNCGIAIFTDFSAHKAKFFKKALEKNILHKSILINRNHNTHKDFTDLQNVDYKSLDEERGLEL